MINEITYDVAIVGGGLAGLALAIQLARKDYKVIVFEKRQYPFHKVCGEYISQESRPFLESLNIPLGELKLPIINQLKLSSSKGKIIRQQLPLGGFGISRYQLDYLLAQEAEKAGATILTDTKVDNIIADEEAAEIRIGQQSWKVKVCCATYGKRSNIDIKWHRKFVREPANKLNNYVGIKYHIAIDAAKDTIALHNFKDGYCGFSPIEDDKFCLCYLTKASNLTATGNDIKKMEVSILSRNPHLKKIFRQANFLYEQPLVISQISFAEKQQCENHVLMIGDAAGMITPLCGNGMSMALHGSKIAFKNIDAFLNGKINRVAMEKQYTQQWRQQFYKRLEAGRMIQKCFGSSFLNNFFLSIIQPFPAIQKKLIRLTHGDVF